MQSVSPSAHGAVLGVLARTSEPLSGRRIAALTRPQFSQSRVNRVLGDLVRDGLAETEVRSPAIYYRLNHDHVAAPAVLALAVMWQTLLGRIQAAVADWAVVPVAVWLFGSAARGEANGSSDIDILVVRPELVSEAWQRQLDNLEDQVRRWSGNACELLVLSEQELHASVLRGDRLVDELRRDAIHLSGAQPHSLLGRRDVTALEEARRHLAKAREFLDAAETSRDLGLNNAAASSAVIAAINSKDAICIALTGRTGKSDNHAQAVDELRRSGPAGRDLASTLTRLLQLKTRSQYASLSVAAADASKAVEWANKMYLAAEGVVRDR